MKNFNIFLFLVLNTITLYSQTNPIISSLEKGKEITDIQQGVKDVEYSKPLFTELFFAKKGDKLLISAVLNIGFAEIKESDDFRGFYGKECYLTRS